MRKVFDEIKEIDLNIDNCSLPEAICKFSEESGEMIREMNKYFGRKKTSENEETIRENVKEEIADTIQNLFILTHRFNISI